MIEALFILLAPFITPFLLAALLAVVGRLNDDQRKD